MGGFVKVYDSILESSVWGESLSVRVVWIAMLAMSDRNGLVAASSDGISRRANVPLKATEQALSVLESPDTRSKSQDFDGRRIERIDGGYQILNYKKYRELQTDKQKDNAARQKRYRERHNGDVALRNRDITPLSRRTTPKAKANAKAEANTETTKPKATTSESGDPALKSPSWVVEGVEWWKANVGEITHGHFGKALSSAVQAWTWPEVFPALKSYVEDARSRGKPINPNWFAKEIVHWLSWSKMPVTDDSGLLTPRGLAMTREERR